MTEQTDAGARRILFAIDGLGCGGAQRQLVALLKHLPRGRFAPVVLSMSAPSFFDATVEAHAPLHSIRRRFRFDLGVLGRFRRLARELEVDLIHTLDWMTSTLWRWALRGRGPLLVNGSVRDAPARPTPRMRWYMRTLSRYRWVVANSHAGLRAYRQAGLPRRLVIHNGFDLARVPEFDAPEARRRLGLPAHAFIIAMAGQLEPRKDFRTFLDAVALLPAGASLPRTLALVIGDGRDRAALERHAERLGIAKRVQFTGSRRDIECYWRAADVAVLCSAESRRAAWHGEGTPNTLIEALGGQTPVIGTDTGGTRELVIDGQTGRLIPPGNPRALAVALAELRADPKDRARLACAGHAHVVREFSLSAMIEAYTALYDRAICDQAVGGAPSV